MNVLLNVLVSQDRGDSGGDDTDPQSSNRYDMFRSNSLPCCDLSSFQVRSGDSWMTRNFSISEIHNVTFLLCWFGVRETGVPIHCNWVLVDVVFPLCQHSQESIGFFVMQRKTRMAGCQYFDPQAQASSGSCDSSWSTGDHAAIEDVQ